MDLTAKGTNGQLSFDGTSVTITREGLLARASHGRGSKSLFVKSISGVEMKPAGLTAGYIKFSVPGEIAKTRLNGHRATDASKDENSVLFGSRQQAEFETLAQAVREAIANVGQPLAATVDVADQLAKFAALRDQGILTKEEFATKKAELLA